MDERSGGQSKVALDPTADFVAGTVAGIAGLAVGFPLDTVKVRFQSPHIAQKYRSTFHALGTIVREERFVGLYRGISSPLATCAFMNGLVFASYRFFMKIQLKSDSEVPSLSQIALAGAGSGIVCSIITTPTELIKIHQQNLLTANSSSPSARAIALQIYRRYGLKGLYRGITATALRDCGYGAYFTAYEATCRYFRPPSSISTASSNHSSILSEIESEIESLSWPALLVAGGVAGIAGWLGTFPLDVVKTRVQDSQDIRTAAGSPAWQSPTDRSKPFNSTAHSHTKPTFNPYRTTWSMIVHSYHTEGLGVFFKGLSPTLIR